MNAVNDADIPFAEIWAPYRDGFHAAEMADTYRLALIRVQWRGWDAGKGIRVCALCHAPESGGVHYGSCIIGQALNDCPECEGRPLKDGTVANGPNYTMDVPTTCSTCGRSDADYHRRPK